MMFIHYLVHKSLTNWRRFHLYRMFWNSFVSKKQFYVLKLVTVVNKWHNLSKLNTQILKSSYPFPVNCFDEIKTSKCFTFCAYFQYIFDNSFLVCNGAWILSKDVMSNKMFVVVCKFLFQFAIMVSCIWNHFTPWPQLSVCVSVHIW